ncbi:unnamed protein product [Pleuronectes platessa]|uniref:Uncharacterized protein n=1 Tax=Pleuronectes platessa TaxID=8262 RepID=A0A9N7VM03_PLEPL|nr:unnamed protein product [Pleuronectes platessa]
MAEARLDSPIKNRHSPLSSPVSSESTDARQSTFHTIPLKQGNNDHTPDGVTLPGTASCGGRLVRVLIQRMLPLHFFLGAAASNGFEVKNLLSPSVNKLTADLCRVEPAPTRFTPGSPPSPWWITQESCECLCVRAPLSPRLFTRRLTLVFDILLVVRLLADEAKRTWFRLFPAAGAGAAAGRCQ